MTTMADLVTDTRRTVYGTMAEQINVLASSEVAGASTLTFTYDVAAMTPGMILSSGLNVWYVLEVDSTSKTVTVLPGYDGAPEGAVTAGDVVTLNPRAHGFYIFSALCDVIRSLSSPASGLYAVSSWTDDVDDSWQTYEVPVAAESMLGLIAARVLQPGSSDAWIDIPPQYVKWQRDKNIVRLLAPTNGYTSIEFTYRKPFTVPDALTDDPVADVGLATSMLDLPPLGAAVSLLRTTEGRRLQVQAQGDSRRASEVTPGSNLTAAREFERDFRNRVNDEAMRLAAMYPYRMGL